CGGPGAGGAGGGNRLRCLPRDSQGKAGGGQSILAFGGHVGAGGKIPKKVDCAGGPGGGKSTPNNRSDETVRRRFGADGIRCVAGRRVGPATWDRVRGFVKQACKI